MQDTSVDNSGLGAGADDFPIVITTVPATARRHQIAFRGFAICVVVQRPQLDQVPPPIASLVDSGRRCNRRPHPATASKESCRRRGPFHTAKTHTGHSATR
jgi:hypothetical protein